MKIAIHMLSILKFIHIYFIVTKFIKTTEGAGMYVHFVKSFIVQDLCVILLIWIWEIIV